MIFSIFIIHNHYRMSFSTRVLHTATWDYFTSHLSDFFCGSPVVVKETIMTDINDLVQEFWSFWSTSSDEAVGASFFAMRFLLDILQEYYSPVCFHIVPVFAAAVDLLIKIYRCNFSVLPSPSRTLTTESMPNLRECLMGIERCLIGHCLNPSIWPTCLGSYLVS